MEIDAVEQRSGDLAAISQDLRRGTTAGLVGIRRVATGTGVLRGHQHELRRESDRAAHARDRHPAVLEGLAEIFERRARELREFIEEQDAAMSEAHFARFRPRTAADEG